MIATRSGTLSAACSMRSAMFQAIFSAPASPLRLLRSGARLRSESVQHLCDDRGNVGGRFEHYGRAERGPACRPAQGREHRRADNEHEEGVAQRAWNVEAERAREMECPEPAEGLG